METQSVLGLLVAIYPYIIQDVLTLIDAEDAPMLDVEIPNEASTPLEATDFSSMELTPRKNTLHSQTESPQGEAAALVRPTTTFEEPTPCASHLNPAIESSPTTIMPDTPHTQRYDGPNASLAAKVQKSQATQLLNNVSVGSQDTANQSPISRIEKEVWKTPWIQSGRLVPFDEFVRTSRASVRATHDVSEGNFASLTLFYSHTN